MTFPRRLGHSLRALPRDEQGDEGVNKMLILLLVTVPIILVLVIFGGKIVDEFQVGLCKLGAIDPPNWYLVQYEVATYSEESGFVVHEDFVDYDWNKPIKGYVAPHCTAYRLDEGERHSGGAVRPRSGEGYSEE